jgi:hypothetical protein
VNGREVRVHRQVMEILVGRPLERHEDVHHVDGNGLNNEPSNLQLLTHGGHTRVTSQRYPLVRFCCWCGRPFTRTGRPQGTYACCSISCAVREQHARGLSRARRRLPRVSG